MHEPGTDWYFSWMPRRPPPERPGIRVGFDTTKYGPEILVDSAWVHEMPTFIRTGPHWLSFYDILLVTGGRGWYWLDGVRYPVAAGRVFFTSPGQVRDWDVEQLDGLCLFFPEVFLQEFFHDPLFVQRLPYFHRSDGEIVLRLGAKAARSMRARLLRMRTELRKYRSDSPHLLRATLYEVLVTLARQFEEAHPGLSPAALHPAVVRFRELIERDAPRRHRVTDYTSDLAITPGHLNALCRAQLGRSAKDLIQERLVREARQLLLYTDESAGRIGLALGFRDPSYFSRFFRRMTGRSPSAFRASVRRA